MNRATFGPEANIYTTSQQELEVRVLRTSFDPECNIDTPEMLNELKRALSTLTLQSESTVALFMPAEGDFGEICVDDAEFSRQPEGDDWVIVSKNRTDLAEYFVAKIHALIDEPTRDYMRDSNRWEVD